MNQAFEEAREKARNVCRYRCDHCDNAQPFWAAKRVIPRCRDCDRVCRRVLFAQTVGIGWFQCRGCHRRFAGFIRGDLTSKCHECNVS